MDIRVKEPIYILHQGQEYVVRNSSTGIERNRIMMFYDGTRTAAVGFAKDFCLNTPQLFQVSRNITDAEISVKDVEKIIESSELPDNIKEDIINKIKLMI